MFYKPKFCCECGSKVERENWSLLASRRFCDDCASDFEKLPQRITIFAVAAFALIGIGIFSGQGLKEKTPPVVLTPNAPQANQIARTQTPQPNKITAVQSPANPTLQTASKAQQQTLIAAQNQTAQNQTAQNLIEPSEAAYFCGARTQKGTPCSRRVRGGGRCWQHIGKPAMLPADKLKIVE